MQGKPQKGALPLTTGKPAQEYCHANHAFETLEHCAKDEWLNESLPRRGQDWEAKVNFRAAHNTDQRQNGAMRPQRAGRQKQNLPKRTKDHVQNRFGEVRQARKSEN